MKPIHNATVTPLVALALLTASVGNAQSYPIHMSMPVHAGQHYTITASGSKLAKTVAGDRVMSAEEYQVSFVGQAEVLEVDSGGVPFKVAFTVEELTKSADGTTTILLKPKSVILADGSQKQPFSLKDGSIEDAVQKAFSVVYAAHKPNDVPDDEIFGTTERKRIGDTWPINPARAYESLQKTGITIPERHISGTVTLTAKDRVASTDCLSIRGEFQADSITGMDLPNDITVEQGTLQAAFRGCFPLEGSGLSFKTGADVTMRVRVVSKDGPRFDVTYSQKTDAAWVATGK